MERKVGEKFDFNGVTLEVVKTCVETCVVCYFYEKEECNLDITGHCVSYKRNDNCPVIFREVTK